jgi:uncharacterized membrane protein
MEIFIEKFTFWGSWAIVLIGAGLILHELFKSKDWKLQATAAITLIPFLLRIFLIK